MPDDLTAIKARWGVLHEDVLTAGEQHRAEYWADHASRDIPELLDRITRALEYVDSGQVDGEHHKAWAIDQIVRALTGCPIVTRTAVDTHGERYEYPSQGESEEYRRFLAAYRAGEDGPDTYHWEEGIAP
jgi:hypothetical protein